MNDFTIVERTEPFTLKEVLDFIDDTNISKRDAHELKSRIVDVVQAERNKFFNELVKALNDCDRYTAERITHCLNGNIFPKNEVFVVDDVYEIAEQLKEGAE